MAYPSIEVIFFFFMFNDLENVAFTNPWVAFWKSCIKLVLKATMAHLFMAAEICCLN
jgi:hypothetical protein